MYVRRYKAKQPKTDSYFIMPLFGLIILVSIAKIGLIVGAVLLVCAIIWGIVISVQQAINEKKEKEKILAEKESFLHSRPPAIKHRSISKRTAGYLEVENIRNQFERFVNEEDVVMWKQSYLDWLIKKSVIQQELSVEVENQQELNSKMIETRTELEVLKANLNKYAMTWYSFPWMKKNNVYNNAFAPLKNKLNQKSESETLNRFFNKTPKVFCSIFNECEYIFTPLFILKYIYEVWNFN